METYTQTIHSELIQSDSRTMGINKPRILRALLYTRKAMTKDVWEADGLTRAKGTKRGRGTTKQPAFGIYARKVLFGQS